MRTGHDMPPHFCKPYHLRLCLKYSTCFSLRSAAARVIPPRLSGLPLLLYTLQLFLLLQRIILTDFDDACTRSAEIES